MNMDELKKVISLWNNYFAILHVNEYEFDKYLKIVNKLRNNNLDFIKNNEKKHLLELLEILSETIYNYKNFVEKYDDSYKRTEENYEDELNYCSRVINYLENEIINDSENV